MTTRTTLFGAALLSVLATAASAEDPSILVQSTTSTQNSGFYDYILPIYKEETGVTVNVVAVGTGQAIKNAQNCDADVLLVHAKSAEEKFVADGFGVARSDLMYNDFVIVGSSADPAAIAGGNDAVSAFKTIAEKQALFASRGDDSGTNKAELKLWNQAGVDITSVSGDWYRATGSGMGATLNASVGMGAYTMSDRATWISFGNKGDYQIVVEGDPVLFNQYGIILVNPDKCPSVKAELGQQFIDWMISPHGQELIAGNTLDGKQLFFPNAKP
ncbi:ABC-type tungstate transport system, permease component [Hoeflea sp. IMCC20628]|uniref:substrate-binding domain-containing protein n=1 Tax=Hoeflea sp. IMCC20628 TaxID=1620421 RepID=UPI00063AB2DE|nr:substrate-binding domain-containing protein [Hoeflea sp. IMCC20628]AKI01986.1 ABC-type tungstate transport system, permease component [Hoeflea sp. IMCC20628]